MNKVILLGRLTRDPDVKTTQGGTKIANFCLAVGRGEYTSFIECTAFKTLADLTEKYLQKGKQIVIEGEWRQNKYTNRDGVQVKTDYCAIQSIHFTGKKDD